MSFHFHHHDHHDHHVEPHAGEMPGDGAGRGSRPYGTLLVLGIAINMLYVVTEFTAGLFFDSAGLLSDAGHNLGDVGSMFLSLLAVALSCRSANRHYTYGYGKSTILASLVNSLILLVAVGFIVCESIQKLLSPEQVAGAAIAWVAALGILINAGTALLFFADRDRDLNIKGVWLHMMADALVSLGVVVSGIVIAWTGWYVLDPIIGLTIALVILVSTWSLLRESLRLTMDGVPENTDVETIRQLLESQPRVVNVHHLHIWALSTSKVALTAHLVLDSVDSVADEETIKQHLKEVLRDAGIPHSTLEMEVGHSVCLAREHSGTCA